MRRHEAKSVGEIIEEAIAATGDKDEYYRQQAAFLWQEVVGATINQATMRRYVDGDTLHVYLSSAVLKSELTYITPSLIRNINKLVGRNVITKIVVH